MGGRGSRGVRADRGSGSRPCWAPSGSLARPIPGADDPGARFHRRARPDLPLSGSRRAHQPVLQRKAAWRSQVPGRTLERADRYRHDPGTLMEGHDILGLRLLTILDGDPVPGAPGAVELADVGELIVGPRGGVPAVAHP